MVDVGLVRGGAVRGAGLPAAVLHGRLGPDGHIRYLTHVVGEDEPLPPGAARSGVPRRGRRALVGPHRPPLDALRGLDDDDDDGGSPYAGLAARRAALLRPGADPAEGAEVARLIRERDELRAKVAAVLQDQGARAASIPVDPAADPSHARGGRGRCSARVPRPQAFAGGLLLGPALGSRAEVLPTIALAQLPEPVVARPKGGRACDLHEYAHITDRPIVTPEGDLVATSFRRLVTLQGAGVNLYAARPLGARSASSLTWMPTSGFLCGPRTSAARRSRSTQRDEGSGDGRPEGHAHRGRGHCSFDGPCARERSMRPRWPWGVVGAVAVLAFLPGSGFTDAGGAEARDDDRIRSAGEQRRRGALAALADRSSRGTGRGSRSGRG